MLKVQHHSQVDVYEGVVTLRGAGSRVPCRRPSSTRFDYHSREQTTRVDVETLRRRRSADVVYPTPSTRALSRTEQASQQQTLVQRIVAAVEREAEGRKSADVHLGTRDREFSRASEGRAQGDERATLKDRPRHASDWEPDFCAFIA